MEDNNLLFEPSLENLKERRIYDSRRFIWVAILAGLLPLCIVYIANLKTICLSKRVINTFLTLAILIFAIEFGLHYYTTKLMYKPRSYNTIEEYRKGILEEKRERKKAGTYKSVVKLGQKLLNVLYLFLYKMVEKRQILYYYIAKDNLYKPMIGLVIVIAVMELTVIAFLSAISKIFSGF
ncbi:hypothetical protein [Caldicellulosiruptor changbaiensis]|uniref:hypothetical protein n=1 Tax=Caldicellulosiruptor changbaiensis TaxID=1222016 RepID=UPI001F49D5D5|nr:hypothetical protein [Caldicellulosiruptor changbaiensis]